MTHVGLVLANDSAEFRRAAEWWEQQTDPAKVDVRLHPISSAKHMVDASDAYASESVARLVVFAHGTTNCFGKPGKWGVDTRPARWASSAFIAPAVFARAWAPVLEPDALVSLACCLCSRSPHWYLTKVYGSVISPWGPEAYRDGGLRSPAAQLALSLASEGRNLRVRGHCAAGHTIQQALLREHLASVDNGLGRSLFQKLRGASAAANRVDRNLWQKVVRGNLAASWLLGLDDRKTEREVVDRLAGLL